jgi:glycogen debranching enzyme
VDDVIRLHDRYYILATSGLSDDRTRVLKHGDTFAVFDRHGDVQPIGLGQQGVFDRGTRGLSRFDVRIAGVRPLLLSSTLDRDNALLLVSLTNPDLQRDGRVEIPRNTVHLERSSVVFEGGCHTRLTLRSFDREAVDLLLAVGFEADFCDVFEVRGVRRARRGTLHEPRVDGARVVLAYTGLDAVTRRTAVRFDRAPVSLSSNRADFALRLPPAGRADLEIEIDCRADDTPRARPVTFDDAVLGARTTMLRMTEHDCAVRTSNSAFNDWIARSTADLAMMTTQTPEGPVPYAGVPWFCTPFGRDAIVTALELLWANPRLARGVLRFLAATQATENRAESDAEPGKILHEMRAGEMAALGEIPFARYYGSVDATPLFVLLAAAYYDRTGDDALVREIWPNVLRALDWIAHAGDPDGDGFVEYARRSRDGLRNQGWKDSEDSVFHADGSLAEGPIALCEVQAYVYAAKRGAARLAGVMGERDRSRMLLGEARTLRARFESAFWCDDQGTYALALDGDKQPCRVRTSNPGHCLFTGIASPTRARLVAGTLMHPDLFSGWGVRTVASDERRYCTACSTPASPSTCNGCPSWCAASRACRGRARRSIRWPVRPNRGRRVRSSCCSRRASACRSTDPSAACASPIPACRASSRRSGSAASASATRSSTSSCGGTARTSA